MSVPTGICPKHGAFVGECELCTELARARDIVRTSYIPTADPHPDHDSQNMWDEECQHNEGGIRGGYCTDCGELIDEDAASEAAWERQQEEGFRGGEAAAFMAEEQERARRLK